LITWQHETTCLKKIIVTMKFLDLIYRCRNRISAGPKTIVCQETELKGEVSIGAGTNKHSLQTTQEVSSI
jgi:hypothetical protein